MQPAADAAAVGDVATPNVKAVSLAFTMSLQHVLGTNPSQAHGDAFLCALDTLMLTNSLGQWRIACAFRLAPRLLMIERLASMP